MEKNISFRHLRIYTTLKLTGLTLIDYLVLDTYEFTLLSNFSGKKSLKICILNTYEFTLLSNMITEMIF